MIYQLSMLAFPSILQHTSLKIIQKSCETSRLHLHTTITVHSDSKLHFTQHAPVPLVHAASKAIRKTSIIYVSVVDLTKKMTFLYLNYNVRVTFLAKPSSCCSLLFFLESNFWVQTERKGRGTASVMWERMKEKERERNRQRRMERGGEITEDEGEMEKNEDSRN